MSEWVDLQLSHQLSAVKAPEQLWERLETFPRPRRRHFPRLALATAAAIIAVIATAYSSMRPHETPHIAGVTPGSCNLCHTM